MFICFLRSPLLLSQKDQVQIGCYLTGSKHSDLSNCVHALLTACPKLSVKRMGWSFSPDYCSFKDILKGFRSYSVSVDWYLHQKIANRPADAKVLGSTAKSIVTLSMGLYVLSPLSFSVNWLCAQKSSFLWVLAQTQTHSVLTVTCRSMIILLRGFGEKRSRNRVTGPVLWFLQGKLVVPLRKKFLILPNSATKCCSMYFSQNYLFRFKARFHLNFFGSSWTTMPCRSRLFCACH